MQIVVRRDGVSEDLQGEGGDGVGETVVPETVSKGGEENGRGLSRDAGERQQDAGGDAPERGGHDDVDDDLPPRDAERQPGLPITLRHQVKDFLRGAHDDGEHEKPERDASRVGGEGPGGFHYQPIDDDAPYDGRDAVEDIAEEAQPPVDAGGTVLGEIDAAQDPDWHADSGCQREQGERAGDGVGHASAGFHRRLGEFGEEIPVHGTGALVHEMEKDDAERRDDEDGAEERPHGDQEAERLAQGMVVGGLEGHLLLDGASEALAAEAHEQQLGDEVHDDREGEENQADLEKGLQISVRGRFGELVGDDAGEGIAGLEKRSGDDRAVAYDHRDGHRLAQGAAQTEDDGAKESPLGIAENGYAGHLPAGGAERIGGLALEVRHGDEDFPREGGDDGQDHDCDDGSPREEADAIGWAAEEGQPAEMMRVLQPGEGVFLQPWHHDENAPETEDDARYGGEHLHQRDDRLAQPAGSEFREVDGGRDAERHGDEQPQEGGDERSVDEGERAVFLIDGVPLRAEEKAEPELTDGPGRAGGKLPPHEDDEQDDRQRHEQGQPLESFVGGSRRRGHVTRHGFGNGACVRHVRSGRPGPLLIKGESRDLNQYWISEIRFMTRSFNASGSGA